MYSIEVIVVLAVVGAIGSGFVAALHQAHRRKELEHEERMAAMNMGLPPSPHGLNWPAAMVCIAVGAGVPIGTFAVALIATVVGEVPGGIWVAPVFVSFAAIKMAEKLAFRTLKGKPEVRASSAPKAAAKPAFDPEAFEVVGRRG